MERAIASSRDRRLPRGPGEDRIRLMIVDDSVVARAVLSRMVESDGGFEIAAVAGTAEDAIDALRSVRVDTILLDLEMPGAGGLKSIPRIIDAAAGANVMIVSSLADEGAEETVAALALGAADALPKPGAGRFNGRFSEVLLGRLKALGHAAGSNTAEPLAGVATSPAEPQVRAPLRAMALDPLGVLAIGASTGGIHALSSLFSALPARIGVPILVTQHLPVPFIGVFARQLSIASRRETLVAEPGMPLLPDRIIVAPGDAHLIVEQRSSGAVAYLERTRSPSGCLPSLDPMLETAGAVFGSGALGVVLTGMGRDGLVGATALVGKGGSVLVQDFASSAVWGMPRAVLEAGLACGAMTPDKIAARVAARAGASACR